MKGIMLILARQEAKFSLRVLEEGKFVEGLLDLVDALFQDSAGEGDITHWGSQQLETRRRGSWDTALEGVVVVGETLATP